MLFHIIPPFTLANAAGASGIAIIYIALSSHIKESERRKFNANMIGGAEAAYLSEGLRARSSVNVNSI